MVFKRLRKNYLKLEIEKKTRFRWVHDTRNEFTNDRIQAAVGNYNNPAKKMGKDEKYKC